MVDGKGLKENDDSSMGEDSKGEMSSCVDQLDRL